ncbi:MAG: DUF6794 domain-containing protein [Pseudomonadota bacterium]
MLRVLGALLFIIIVPVFDADSQDDEELACGAGNIEQAILCLHHGLSEEDHLVLVEGPLSAFRLEHYGLGMGIRNGWGLWAQKGDLHTFFVSLGINHPDDMSSMILDSYWLHFNGCDLQIDKQVAYYQAYWDQFASLDQGELKVGDTIPIIMPEDPQLDCTNRG